MASWMTHLLYSSFSAAILIAAVLLIRWIVTKRAPRWIACVLWGMVGVRLLVPFSIESELSILPEIELSVQESETESTESGNISEESFGESITVSDVESVESEGESTDETPSVPSAETPSDGSADEVTSEETSEEASDEFSEEHSEETSDEGEASAEEPSDVPSASVSEDSRGESHAEPSEPVSEETGGDASASGDVSAPDAGTQSEVSDTPQGGVADWDGIAFAVWLCGVVLLVLYALVQYALLRRRVAVFASEKGGIRRCEQIDTPFVLGFFRPHIYLPYGLAGDTEKYIVLHEQAHIRRFDHVTKIAAFAALALHWFNPLVWLAFVLFCRDIEYACDEKVVRTLGAEERKQYASALLEFAHLK